MTSEIAIMNKTAVALAADSAVTVGTRSADSQAGKIFNTVNKLFTLSKIHPVGVMIYGRADLVGIPWEILIKEYRRDLSDRCFAKLESYSDDFLRFLARDTVRIPPDFEDAAFVQQTTAYLISLRDGVNNKVSELFKANKIVNDETVSSIMSKAVLAEHSKWSSASLLPNARDGLITELFARYNEVLIQTIAQVFEKLPVSQLLNEQLRMCCCSIPCKDLFNENIRSGIVIAGFGADDIFPSVVEIGIELRVAQHLKYRIIKVSNISIANQAQVSSFAQAEMVRAFMEGIDPQFKLFHEGYLASLLPKIPNLFLEIADLAPEKQTELLGKMPKLIENLLSDYQTQVSQYSRTQYIDPVLNIVASLPKDELAEMAEALVSLTSFKKKVSPVAETVGGPIDVALITKGDGFIWMKRKHYFKPELNAQFFSNYNRQPQTVVKRRRGYHGQ